MSNALTCPSCAATFRPGGDLRGKNLLCPTCGQPMVVTGIARPDVGNRVAPTLVPAGRCFPWGWLAAALLLSAAAIVGILLAARRPEPKEEDKPVAVNTGDGEPADATGKLHRLGAGPAGKSEPAAIANPPHQEVAYNAASAQNKKPNLPGLPPLKVVGTHLTTLDGKVARLRGVNLPTLEWGQGEHLFRSLDVLVGEWQVNFIRLTVSGDRWFGHTRERKDGGARYRQTVREFVKRAAARRCYVLLNLHFLNPGVWLDEDPVQKGRYLVWMHKMPGDHSVDFWASAAREFANHPAVLFDLYNEPGKVSWQVWRNGGNLVEKHKKAPGGKWEYHSPGMQKLLDTCRAQGARNVVVAEGLAWGFDLSGIVKGFALKDPGSNGVAYSTHLYSWTKDGPRGLNRCVTPTAKKYAVLIGEFCAGKSNSVEPIVSYADQYQLPWLAWSFHTGIGPRLIKNWKYEPTPYGESVKKALWEAARRERAEKNGK